MWTSRGPVTPRPEQSRVSAIGPSEVIPTCQSTFLASLSFANELGHSWTTNPAYQHCNCHSTASSHTCAHFLICANSVQVFKIKSLRNVCLAYFLSIIFTLLWLRQKPFWSRILQNTQKTHLGGGRGCIQPPYCRGKRSKSRNPYWMCNNLHVL
jgi:hypothetical protein